MLFDMENLRISLLDNNSGIFVIEASASGETAQGCPTTKVTIKICQRELPARSPAELTEWFRTTLLRLAGG
jgi:hypothetical protein